MFCKNYFKRIASHYLSNKGLYAFVSSVRWFSPNQRDLNSPSSFCSATKHETRYSKQTSYKNTCIRRSSPKIGSFELFPMSEFTLQSFFVIKGHKARKKLTEAFRRFPKHDSRTFTLLSPVLNDDCQSWQPCFSSLPIHISFLLFNFQRHQRWWSPSYASLCRRVFNFSFFNFHPSTEPTHPRHHNVMVEVELEKGEWKYCNRKIKWKRTQKTYSNVKSEIIK